MELVSFDDLVFYQNMIKLLFIFIGFCAFLFYTFNTEIRPISPCVVLVLFVLMVVVLGAYPIHAVQTDRYRYMREAIKVASGLNIHSHRDIGYSVIVHFLTCFPIEWYLYLHSILYVLGIFIFSRSLSKYNYGVIFLMMLLNFQFVSYGINTMRAGVAGSTLLLAMASRNRKILECLFLLFAIFIHKSFLLPVVCYIFARKYDRTDIYFMIWFFAIFLSAFAGSFFQQLMGSFMGLDERVSYFTKEASNTRYNVGFRWDFLLFSCMPMVYGSYMIFKLKFNDYFYKVLFNTYMLANTFWILVIRADYSDRFAYLSWFIYCPLLIYPIVKEPDLVSRPHKWIAYMILFLVVFRTLL